jgi:hypothetical protein
MRTIPAWKIKRELRAIYDLIAHLPTLILGPIWIYIYDLLQSRFSNIRFGLAPDSPKVAILVVYQPRGLSDPTVLTCQHLAKHGYAVFLVSNGTLPEESVERLIAHCWKILERPNIGYDFGAYRDAILHLKQRLPSTENLLLMNDSIWYPSHEQDDLISRLECHPAAFVGPMLFGSPESSDSKKRKHGLFVGSFMMMFKRTVLNHRAFLTYWQSYQMTGNKQFTMSRGERGLSNFMSQSGHAPEGLVSEDSIRKKLIAMSEEDIDLVLDNLVHIEGEEDIMRIRHAVSILSRASSSQDSTKRLNITESTNDTQSTERAHKVEIMMSFLTRPNPWVRCPWLVIDLLKVPYIKKRTDLPLYRSALKDIMRRDRSRSTSRLLPVVSREINDRLRAIK